MAHIDTVLKQLDSEVIATVQRGGDLNQLPIADWQAFVPGFVKRNAVQASAQRTRGLVAEKIYSTVWSLRWDLPRLIECSFLLFPYEQVQMHLSFHNLLWKLLSDSILYMAAQEAVKTEATRAVNAEPASARRYWDEWDNWIDGDVRRPDEWDIERVNHTADQLANLAAYLTLFAGETEAGADPHGYAEVIAAALPEVQAFQAHFPTFCAILNEANVLNLTEKVIIREPVELKVALPTVTVAEKAHPWRPLAQVEKANSAADFQGFFIGIVLEPRAADDRDLDNCYMSKEEIEKACDHWSIHHQKIRVGHDPETEAHAFEHEHYRCVRNWIQIGDTVIGGYPVRDGTWLQGYQCMSEQAKSDVENHVINGLSPNGPCTIWKDKPQEEAA